MLPLRYHADMSSLTYANRHGDRYYLHACRTRTGKLRNFVAKTSGEGTLDTMPEGYGFTESINGVVSVRCTNRLGSQAPEQHAELVRAEMGQPRAASAILALRVCAARSSLQTLALGFQGFVLFLVV